eukprot:CAMPEP_0180029430 /NCGR_PEP_ID=MMETSP0984-20121128/26827_1 /TAXON_ID=483367 /ORGANISM="non described non described, Strain CCMP 2436" /LENGTH=109 /DNA_ID=CAMNT_0021954413 /DNA_START=71 /DNA_END=400 /DNA_ORIENTATION=-
MSVPPSLVRRGVAGAVGLRARQLEPEATSHLVVQGGGHGQATWSLPFEYSAERLRPTCAHSRLMLDHVRSHAHANYRQARWRCPAKLIRKVFGRIKELYMREHQRVAKS